MGIQTQRTRVMNITNRPRWEEEFVFDVSQLQEQDMSFKQVMASKALGSSKLRRSTHVKSVGELVVGVWCMQQPQLANIGEQQGRPHGCRQLVVQLGQQQQQQPAPVLSNRPSLAAIHGGGSLNYWRQTSDQAVTDGLMGQWDWESLGRLSEEEDDEEDHREARPRRWGRKFGRRSSAADDRSSADSSLDGSGSEDDAYGSTGSTAADAPGGKKKRRGVRGQDRRLYLVVRVQLGSQQAKSLKPTVVGQDGTAAVNQAAVFAVSRPLEEVLITCELAFGIGPRGPPLLVVAFQVSLLKLIKRSPSHPVTWEEWRQVALCTCKGLQLPLQKFPAASLTLSAFVADADIRAGMCQVPPAVTLRPPSKSSNSSTAATAGQGVSLLMRCGPHWLQLSPAAVPLTTYGSSGGMGALEVPSSSSTVPPVQDHVKTLTLYSDRRGSSGRRRIAGSVLLRLAAGPPPGYSRLAAWIRMCYSYVITPHTLELHTSGVLRSMSRDDMDGCHAALVQQWLAGQAQHALPPSLVGQLLSSGRGAASTRRMRGHVLRIKAVLLDWLPRRLDPLAFYYWKRPINNILALWMLSHACLYPHKW
eukprot:gene4373-4626_t